MYPLICVPLHHKAGRILLIQLLKHGEWTQLSFLILFKVTVRSAACVHIEYYIWYV